MNINNEFNIGQSVWLKTDTEQLERIITRIFVSEHELIYEASIGHDMSVHYGFELLKTRDELKALNIRNS